jgi:hypothetical protein
MEIEESCMIRNFTEFDNFRLADIVSRCQSNVPWVDTSVNELAYVSLGANPMCRGLIPL